MHPWEDFAESFAHYLHITDTLGTAAAGGLVLHADRVADRANRLVAADVVPRASYDGTPMGEMLADWHWLSLLFNRVNHAMGRSDLYPFTLTAAGGSASWTSCTASYRTLPDEPPARRSSPDHRGQVSPRSTRSSRSRKRSAALDDSPRHSDTTSPGCSSICAASAPAIATMCRALQFEHLRDVDRAAIGEDQLEEQLTAQVAQMDHGCGEPLPQMGPARARGRENRAVATGDPRLLANRLDVATDGQLVERAVREGSRQRPHPTDVALRLQARGDREAVGGRRVEDAQARPLTEQQLLFGCSSHAHHRRTPQASTPASSRASACETVQGARKPYLARIAWPAGLATKSMNDCAAVAFVASLVITIG